VSDLECEFWGAARRSLGLWWDEAADDASTHSRWRMYGTMYSGKNIFLGVLPAGPLGSGGSGEKRLALLVLHQPGGVDDRHLRTVQEAAAAAPQKAAKPQAAAMQGAVHVVAPSRVGTRVCAGTETPSFAWWCFVSRESLVSWAGARTLQWGSAQAARLTKWCLVSWVGACRLLSCGAPNPSYVCRLLSCGACRLLSCGAPNPSYVCTWSQSLRLLLEICSSSGPDMLAWEWNVQSWHWNGFFFQISSIINVMRLRGGDLPCAVPGSGPYPVVLAVVFVHLYQVPGPKDSCFTVQRLPSL